MANRSSYSKSRIETSKQQNKPNEKLRSSVSASAKKLNDFPIDTNYKIKNELLNYSENANESAMMEDNYFWAHTDNSQDEGENYWDESILQDFQSENNEDASSSSNKRGSYNLTKIYEVENKCAVCFKNFSSQRDLIQHVKQYHPYDKAFKCIHCTTVFSKLKSISTHLKRCHPDLADTYSCKYCSKAFFRRNLLERHVLIHADEIAKEAKRKEKEVVNFEDHYQNNDMEDDDDNNDSYKSMEDDNSFDVRKSMDNNSNENSEDIFERRKGKIYPIEDKCGICRKKFSHQKILICHVQRSHPNDKAYKCLYCSTLFSKLKSVTTHYKRGHSKLPKKISCETCGMSFYTKFLLDRHKRVHVEMRPFGCNQCDKAYKYKRNLLVHKKTHLRDKNKLANTSNNKEQDLIDKDEEEDGEEEDEYYENEDENEVQEQIEISDDDDNNENESQESGEEDYDNFKYNLPSFKADEYYENDDDEDDYGNVDKQQEPYKNQTENMTLRNTNSNGEGNYNSRGEYCPFKCGVCGRVYSYKKTLKYHQKKHNHIELNDDIDNSTANESNISTQKVTTNNVTPNNTFFIIEEYNAGNDNNIIDLDNDEEDYFTPDYTTESNYYDNSQISADVSQFDCGVCLKEFKCQQAVAKHLQRCHPEIEFFKCPYCDDNYYSLKTLDQHIKAVNHPQKRNVCDLCLKSFDRGTDLRRHRRIHTDERPYICSICQKSFKQDTHLKRHMEVMHSGMKSLM